MNNQSKNLTKLRQAILDGQIQQQAQILCTIFATNVTQATLFVAHEMLLSSLRFQQTIDIQWVAEFARKVNHFIDADNSESQNPILPVELEADYSNDPPGIPNFKSGVEMLWQSLFIPHQPHDDAELWVLPFSRETHIHHQKG